MLVLILEFFSMYEVARLQRYVCLEFRDAGQERIHVFIGGDIGVIGGDYVFHVFYTIAPSEEYNIKMYSLFILQLHLRRIQQ